MKSKGGAFEMNKIIKNMCFIFVVTMIISFIPNVDAYAAKAPYYVITSEKTYGLNSNNKLVLSSANSYAYNENGQKIKEVSQTYGKNKSKSVGQYVYKKGYLTKVNYNNGSYKIYAWKKDKVDKIKKFDKNKQLISTTIYSYSKGKLATVVEKKGKIKLTETKYYPNGNFKEYILRDAKGRVTYAIKYDGRGNKKVVVSNYYDQDKKTSSSKTTYDNKYNDKKILTKAIAIKKSGDYVTKNIITYYTKGAYVGLPKDSTYFAKSDKKFVKSDSYTYKYTADKAGNITKEEMVKVSNKKVVSKTVRKYKKIS